jgi:hypothetical protein
MNRAFLTTEVTVKFSMVDSIASLAILEHGTFRHQVHVIGRGNLVVII